MNLFHRWYCRTDHWKRTVETGIVPWALEDLEVRGPALEIGPGPGVTTDYLRKRVSPLTAIERDASLADALRRRIHDAGVTVVEGDAAAMPFPNEEFETVFCFTMLHHVPSPALQDRVLAEAARVLRPGGRLVGTDSLGSLTMTVIHWGDTLVLVDPATLGARLRRAGFADATVEPATGRFRFRATRGL